MRPIEIYLRSLGAALRERLPAGVTAERLREASGHLEMSAAEVGEEEAVRQYGPLRGVANGLVRAHRGYVIAKPSRLALGVGAAVYLGVSLPYCWLQIVAARNGSIEGAVAAIAWGPSLAMALFFGRVVQTRRWLFLPVTLWGLAASTTIVGCGLLVPPDFDRKHLPNARREVAIWEGRREGVVAWREGRSAPPGGPKLYPLESSRNLPFTPFSISTMDVYPGYDDSLRGAATRVAWQSVGPRWAEEVDERLTQANDTLSLVMHPERLRDRVNWGDLAVMVFQSAALGAAMFLFANACGIALGGLLDRRRVRQG